LAFYILPTIPCCLAHGHGTWLKLCSLELRRHR
jgi:hypothetical protein